jgi:ABC-2 type transport system permease protein
MSAITVLDSERIKLSTTRSPLWTAVAVAVLSLGVAALQGMTAHGAAPLPPERAALGVAVFGVPMLMVLASMMMTGEYRSGLIRTTFIATPNRTLVLAAKAVVAAVFSGIYTAVMVVGSVLVTRLFATPPTGSHLSLLGPDTWHAAGAIALYAVMAAVLGVGVGALLRAGPGAVAVLLLWPLVAEPMLGNLPDAGPRIGRYLPFANVFVFTDVSWLYPVYDMPWGRLGSLAYFSAMVAMVFVAAAVVLNRRDA